MVSSTHTHRMSKYFQVDRMNFSPFIKKKLNLYLEMDKRKILLIISLLFMVGGVARLLANENILRILGMEHLWSHEPFFLYIYRLLGVFVIWAGIILFVCSKDMIRYRGVIRGSVLALILFFLVSLLTGLSVGLELRFFLVDSIFSFFLIIVLLVIQKD
jgi:hypothetical protein